MIAIKAPADSKTGLNSSIHVVDNQEHILNCATTFEDRSYPPNYYNVYSHDMEILKNTAKALQKSLSNRELLTERQ